MRISYRTLGPIAGPSGVRGPREPRGTHNSRGRREVGNRAGNGENIGREDPKQRRLNPDGYYKLERLIWSGTEEEALARGSPVEQLKPPWKVMLLSEGSVTRHLELLFGKPGVRVDCFEMKDVGPFTMDKIPCTCEIPGLDLSEEGYQTVRRQVFLMQDRAEPFVYAVSFWRKDAVDEYLKDKQLPIWASLSAERRELYREIVDVQLGFSAPLQEAFGCDGPLWARTYVFWHDLKPLTIIHEVFSNKLDRYLGPSSDDDEI